MSSQSYNHEMWPGWYKEKTRPSNQWASCFLVSIEGQDKEKEGTNSSLWTSVLCLKLHHRNPSHSSRNNKKDGRHISFLSIAYPLNQRPALVVALQDVELLPFGNAEGWNISFILPSFRFHPPILLHFHSCFKICFLFVLQSITLKRPLLPGCHNHTKPLLFGKPARSKLGKLV